MTRALRKEYLVPHDWALRKEYWFPMTRALRKEYLVPHDWDAAQGILVPHE